ncbi:semaphorin-4A [Symphorus nematophorus]
MNIFVILIFVLALPVAECREENISVFIHPSIIIIMSPSVLLLLLGLLSSAGSLPPPRTSFLLNSTDRPLFQFSLPDIHNTTTLLLSEDGSTLYVGARDALLSLDVSQSDVIKLKKKVEWSPSQSEINDCQSKGKHETVDCPNFVRVLQPINSTHLYACGSYAYSPHDAYIDIESFSMVQNGGAKGRCPFSPFQRNTAITVGGELFTATTTDFRGVKPQISRHLSKDGRPDVSQDLTVGLLEEPAFVSSSADPSDRKLYFFFSEVGKEFSFVDELRIARVAQVCKDDIGGQRTLQRKWTSFAKAPLICQTHKQLPFNVLQDVFTLQPSEGDGDVSDTLFYGVFTSQWSSGPESAVCVFKLQDVKRVFTQSYRIFDMQTHQWNPMVEQHSYLGKCGLETASDSDLAEVKRIFLTSDSVKPFGTGPIVVSSAQRYSRVAAMRTQAANGKQYTVLFLLTESGFVHKVGLFDQGPHVIEEIQVFTQPQPVQSIVLSSKGVLYVGTSEGVTAVPVAKCSIYRSCSQCVLARDPLCGWSRTRRVCTGLDGTPDNIAQDLEDANVEKECQGQTERSVDTELNVHMNEAVSLQCLKPSNLAALTWTSPRFKDLPEKLFIQSADGSLRFLANTDTFGTYHCEAEEGNHKEVVASYDVRQIAPPRAMTPKTDEDPAHNIEDESFENIFTEKPAITTQTAGDPEDDMIMDKGDAPTTKFTTSLKDKTVSSNKDSALKDSGLDITSSSREDARFRQDHLDNAQQRQKTGEKSYYSELVVVSLMLAACVCVLVLGGLHMWRQKKPTLKLDPLVSPEDGSKTNETLESVPSLSSPDEPEVKVVE